MDWGPAISFATGLVGAVIGWFSTQHAARNNRTDDRRKREIDRVIEALTAIEEAQARYADDIRDAALATKLRLANRRMEFAIGLMTDAPLRSHVRAYAESLQSYYLMVDASPEDIAELGANVPTAAELEAAHQRLVKALRDYASK